MIHFLKTEKTARVVIEGENNPKLKCVWIIAHGYGHLSIYFIKKFKSLFNEENLLIAPEGLHRYYHGNSNDKVGASWMTKEEREKDIEDYCQYFDKVYESYISKLDKKVIINAIGFSQGGATICRWAANTKYKIDNIIIWGINIPPDVRWENDLDNLKTCNWYYVAGDKDEFLTIENQKEQIRILEKHGIKPHALFYDGTHDIDEDALILLTQKCVKKA
jgi:predicted esterase